MPPVEVRPQTFDSFQSPDSASPAVRLEKSKLTCGRNLLFTQLRVLGFARGRTLVRFPHLKHADLKLRREWGRTTQFLVLYRQISMNCSPRPSADQESGLKILPWRATLTRFPRLRNARVWQALLPRTLDL